MWLPELFIVPAVIQMKFIAMVVAPPNTSAFVVAYVNAGSN